MTEEYLPYGDAAPTGDAGQALWHACMEKMAMDMPEQQFNTWLKPLTAQVSEDFSKVQVIVANRFKLDWVRAQYLAPMAAVLERLCGQPMQVELMISQREAPPRQELSARSPAVRAQGADPKGRGSSESVIDFRLEPSGTGTRVVIHTDLKLSGAIAQYGRGAGIVQSFASQVITQFGESLKSQLAQAAATAPEQAPAVASAPNKPISGFTLVLKTLCSAIVQLFRRKPPQS